MFKRVLCLSNDMNTLDLIFLVSALAYFAFLVYYLVKVAYEEVIEK